MGRALGPRYQHVTARCTPRENRGSVFQRRVRQYLLKATRRIHRSGAQGPQWVGSSLRDSLRIFGPSDLLDRCNLEFLWVPLSTHTSPCGRHYGSGVSTIVVAIHLAVGEWP